MQPYSNSEHARQFKRHVTEYRARIEPHPDHAEQYRLTLPDAQAGLAVIDVSEGGVGLRTGIFVPKNMRLTLHIKGADESDSVAPRMLKIRAVARRCEMVDPKPTYHVGLQFVDPGGTDENALIRAVREARAQAAPIGVGA